MNKRLRFERDRTVWIASGKVELGQGINTALAQIAAEELDVALERIRIVPPSTAHSPDEGYTSGSQSVQEGGKNLREACVQARGMLLAHAAELLGAPIGELSVEDGTIRAKNGNSVTYWECAAEATEASFTPSVFNSFKTLNGLGGRTMRPKSIPGSVMSWM